MCCLQGRCCSWKNCMEMVFKVGDFNLDNQDHLDRSSITDEQIKALIKSNPCYMTGELAEILKISKTTVHKHFVKLGYINYFDLWVQHSKQRKIRWIIFPSIIHSTNTMRIYHFWSKMMDDEKWIVYNNTEQKRAWGKRNKLPLATPKTSLHLKKVMLCVWWDWKGILHYELLPNNSQ